MALQNRIGNFISMHIYFSVPGQLHQTLTVKQSLHFLLQEVFYVWRNLYLPIEVISDLMFLN